MKTRPFAMLVVALFLVMSMSQIVVASEDADRIGTFTRLGSTSDLTTDDMVRDGDRLTVRAPVLASRMKVATAFLERELGPAWASSTPFTLTGDGHVRLDAKDTTFRPFVLGAERQFTMGSVDSVRFGERPMWVSVEPYGEGFKLVMDDGNTAGQSVIVAKEWLWERGIHRPVVIHEDGSRLETHSSQNDDAFFFSMPHFSWTIILPDQIDIKGRRDGMFVPHVGQTRWDAGAKIIEIDVALQVSDYDILVEKTWFDANLPVPGRAAGPFHIERLNAAKYLVVHLRPSETPTTIRFAAWSLGSTPVWTFGSQGILAVSAFNETIRDARGAMLVNATSVGTSIHLTVSGSTPFVDVFISYAWLQAQDLMYPSLERIDGRTPFFMEPHEGGGIIVDDPDGTIVIAKGGNYTRREHRVAQIYTTLDVANGTTSVAIPGFRPHVSLGLILQVEKVDWNTSYAGREKIGALAVAVNDQVVQWANQTSDNATKWRGSSTIGTVRFHLPPFDETAKLALIICGSDIIPCQLPQVPERPPLDEQVLWWLAEDVDEALTDDGLVAGLVGRSELADSSPRCDTMVWTDSARKWQNDGVSDDEVIMGGVSYVFLRDWAYYCSGGTQESSYWTRDWGFGWDTRMKTRIHGTGRVPVIHGAIGAAVGATAVSDVELAKLRGAMQKPTHSGFTSSFVASGTSIQDRTIECELSEDEQHGWHAVAVIANLFSAVVWGPLAAAGRGASVASIFIPQQYCTASFEPYDTQNQGVRLWGVKTMSEVDEYKKVSLFGMWDMNTDYHGVQYDMKVQILGDVLVNEQYTACEGDVFPCATKVYKAYWFTSWFPSVPLQFLRE